MENNMPNIKKDKYKLLTPELYPPLKKKTSYFEMDEDKMKEIGEIAQNLINLNELSIYRMLSNKENDYFVNFVNTEKSLQNKYLKKIVEANSGYFPSELSLDKLQKRVISIEEQMKIKMESIKEKPSKNKSKKKQGDIVGRKESYIDALAAPDFVELPKRKVFDEKGKDNNNKKMNDINEGEDDEEIEEEKEEENDEEPSYEDDYRMDSDADNGVSDGDDYSDGGVF